MTEISFLREGVLVFGAAILAAWLFRILRAPSIMGFLIAGMAIGPWGWQLVPAESVEHLAEFGLVLLLFTVGLELSPEPLMRAGRRLLMAALLQIGLTAGVTTAVLGLFTALPFSTRLILGVAVSLSSTAITLKLLSDRGEVHSSMGFISTGVLLLQDVVVIAILLGLSMMSGAKAEAGGSGLLWGVLGLLITVPVLIAARWGLPWVLDQISRHGGRELITLFAVLMACAGAWLASVLGWSPALGACIAGLLLAGADQRHQLVAEITPFRDVFNAMFFISLGMVVNLGTFLDHFALMAALIVVTLLGKTVLTAGAVLVSGWPMRIGLQVGIVLCSVSEFSYVLGFQANQAGLLPEEALDLLLAFAVGTMILGALLFPAARPVAAVVAGRFGGSAPRKEPGHAASQHKDHVVIIGYGFTGSNLAHMLRDAHIPHCLIEMNVGTARAAQKDGVTVIMGDATRMSILEHAGIDTARALVVAVNDHQATQRIVGQVSARRPELYVLARTNFVRDIDRLYQLGAKLVIPQDFETSVEVAAHVLRQFGVPDNIVEAQIASVRAGGYGMLRGKPTDRASTAELVKILERTATQTYYLAEDSAASGKTIAEVNLRAVTGCMIIAVVRAGKPTTNPSPDFQLLPNDVLVLVGAHQQIEAGKGHLQRGLR